MVTILVKVKISSGQILFILYFQIMYKSAQPQYPNILRSILFCNSNRNHLCHCNHLQAGYFTPQ